MTYTPHILIIEDDPDGGRSVQDAVEFEGLTSVLAVTGTDGIAAFQKESFDVVLTDLALPDIDGMMVLERIKSHNAQIPVIIMTAYGSISSSVEALKKGAYDYLTKPLDLDEIQAKIHNALEAVELRKQVETLKNNLGNRYAVTNMIGQTERMQQLKQQIIHLAPTFATILITGESGTGKELVARALHTESERSDQPFVAVNCGAFTETLLESELFGHEKGAFTGASQTHPGAFERADGGTLFLDEIGDAPLSVQVKLLRVLEDRIVTRVGGTKPFKVDVRILSATNRDLSEQVTEGNFREDLLYRLNIIELHIPPLRERRADIRALASFFISKACHDHGRVFQHIDDALFRKLEQGDWPGNIRQLRNTVEAAVLMAHTTELTDVDIRLQDEVQRTAQAPEGIQTAATGLIVNDDMTLEDVEKEMLIRTLERVDGNRTLCAHKLGISRRTILRKIQEYKLPY
ncbi:MAG: sigma-54-dependent Fis family transcriptional regulator [Spartobacteria bacterium]|nr:sigma-54-dependent Fis family transcriptional regulator [Spartobacteria bacterium]